MTIRSERDGAYMCMLYSPVEAEAGEVGRQSWTSVFSDAGEVREAVSD